MPAQTLGAKDVSHSYLTEFLLYNANLVKSNQLEKLYKLGRPTCPVIWKKADEKQCQQAVEKAKDRLTPFFAVHRNAASILSEQAKKIIADFWVERSLFPAADEAKEFLDRQAAATQAFDQLTLP